MQLQILSVNVGLPKPIGRADGQEVLSGIGKRPLDAQSVFAGPENIAGDGQADLSVHGGPDKAVYAYPADHWPWWAETHGLVCGPATFGENLTVLGATESEIRIGERFAWGGAVLEVSQPRAPCYKFAIHTARADMPARMTQSGRCGWYLRVIQPATVPVKAAVLTRLGAEAGTMPGPTVRRAFEAMFLPAIPAGEREQIANHPALAEAWRAGLRQRARR